MRAETADLWSEDAPPESAASPPEETGRDGDAAPTRAEETEKPKAAPAKAAPAPTTDAETVTLTATELATLRRQAADQSATAKRLAQVEKRLALTEQARVASLGEIAQKWDHPEVKAAAYEELVRGQNYVANSIAADETQAAQAAQALSRLDGEKVNAASQIMGAMLTPLHRESAALGVSENDLYTLIAEVKASDPKVQRFEAKFQSARTIEDARDAADSAYELLGERVMARLQDRKIADLREPDDDDPKKKTKTTRTHAFGGGNGAVAVDPLGHLPIAQRARQRAREGIAADMAALFSQQEQ